jgi:sugar phosphate isomerase/epimerase
MSLLRRDFIKGASLAAIGAVAGSAAKTETLKPGLNAYSFNKLLNDAIRKRGPGITLDGVLDFAAKSKFAAFDPTGYFFPGYPKVPENSYVDNLKKHAADLGIALSGTGVRNNFTTADKAVRAQGVAHIKEWVEVAARLEVPVIRVFADTQMKAQTWKTVSDGASRKDVLDWIASALRDCADHAAKYKVKIGVQNHGDFIATGAEQLELVKAVGSPWCGSIVDTGYYKTPDPYVDIALVAPHAVNWQVKQSVFGEDSEVPTDMIRLLKIVRKSGYKGYLPIETLSPAGKPYDPFTVVPDFLAKLNDAIAKTA